MLALGPSLSKFEAHIQELGYSDVLFLGMNHFSVVEDHTLSKINRKLDIMNVCPYHRFCEMRDRIITNLDNGAFLFIASYTILDKTILEKYKNQILVLDTILKENFHGPSWMMSSLILGMIGIKEIFLFGVDYQESEGKKYYRHLEMGNCIRTPVEDLYRHKNIVNERFNQYLKLYELEDMKFYNVNSEFTHPKLHNILFEDVKSMEIGIEV